MLKWDWNHKIFYKKLHPAEKKAGVAMKTWFQRLFLNNKTSMILLNALLALAVLWLLRQTTWLLVPVEQFFKIVLPPLVIAGVLYYLLVPIVNWLARRWHVPRVISIFGLFIGCLLLLAWSLWQVFPLLENQLTSFINVLPGYWQRLAKFATHWFQRQTLPDYIDGQALTKELTNFFSTKSNQLLANTLNQLSNAVTFISKAAITLATVPILLFFMLKDGQHFPERLARYLPKSLRTSVSQLMREISYKIGQYIQGQITVAFCAMCMFMLGYTLIGLRFGLILGLIAGPLNLIPYFGSTIALIPALTVGGLTSVRMFIAVGCVFLIEWFIETQILSPIIMSNSLSLHPVTIVFVLLTAGKLFGLVGLIFGVPGFAILKIIASRFFNWYRRRSSFYDN